MTTAIDNATIQTVLNRANPSNVAQALAEVRLGDLLADMASAQEETLVVDGSLQATFAKVPLGAVMCAYTEGAAHVPLTQMPEGETLGTDEFSVDYETGQITLGGTASSGEEIKVAYFGIGFGDSGSGSELAATLASVYGRAS